MNDIPQLATGGTQNRLQVLQGTPKFRFEGLLGNAEQIDLLNTRASALIICGFDDTLSGPDPAPVVDGELVALPLDSLSEGAGAALPEPMGSFGHLTAFAICELMPVATSPGSPADGPPQKFGA